MSPVTTREVMLLAAILGVAVAARVVGLDAPLWYDEVFTLTHFVRLPLAALLTDFSSLNNHMFYSLQAKAAVLLFGEHPWVLRLPALLLGIASLAVVWVMGRRGAGRAAALLATLLLALSYHHVWFSQNARGYTGLLFWTTLATLVFVRGLERPSLRTWVAYAACFTAGMYTHLSAAFFFAAHGAVFAAGLAGHRLASGGGAWARYPGFVDPRAWAGVGLALALTAVLHVPLAPQIIATVGRVSVYTTAGPPGMVEWTNPLRALQEIAASASGLGVLAPVALLAGLALAAVGIVAIFRRSPILATVYVVHVPLCLLLLVVTGVRIWPRYFFVDIGFVFVCIAAGVVIITRWIGGRLAPRERPRLQGVPLAVAVLGAMAASLVLLAPNYAHPKQDFAGAVALIERQRAPGDIATSAGLAAEPVRSYFAPGWPVVRTAAELEALTAAAPHVWIIIAFQSHTERRYAGVMAMVRDRFELVARLPGTLGDGTVRVYRSRS